MKYARLLLSFDPGRLRQDLEHIGPEEWVPHYNAAGYAGEWSGVALRSVDGAPRQLYADPTASGRYVDTPMLARTPYFRDVLAAFRCPLTAVRLLKLAAHSTVHEHRDHALNEPHGELRIHVPILTNDAVGFFLDGERLRLGPGEAWYLDLERPHRVENASDHARVHLVLDCLANEWLRSQLQPPAVPAGAPAPVPGAAVYVRRADGTAFADPVVAVITRFLGAIGLDVVAGSFAHDTTIPGISIDRGALVVDERRLRHPGDLLHEAGHLAVVAPARRRALTGDAGREPAEEMMAIAWSYAAALHLGLDPAVVFHAEGYRGGATSLLENFGEGRYLAVPMLQWLGLAYDAEHAAAHGARPYPAMARWLLEEGPPPVA